MCMLCVFYSFLCWRTLRFYMLATALLTLLLLWWNTLTKLKEWQNLFQLIFPGHSLSLREVREGAQAETETKIMEEHYLLGWSLTHVQLISYTAQGHLPKERCCPWWNNQLAIKGSPQKTYWQGNVNKAMILHWASLFPSDSRLYQIENKNNQHSLFGWCGGEHESVGVS